MYSVRQKRKNVKQKKIYARMKKKQNFHTNTKINSQKYLEIKKIKRFWWRSNGYFIVLKIAKQSVNTRNEKKKVKIKSKTKQ